MTAAFIGHRTVFHEPAVQAWLISILTSLIHNGTDTFYMGNRGRFDNLAARTLRTLKESNPYITSTLVLNHPNQPYLAEFYDTVVHIPYNPEEKRLIQRNRWMIDHSDIIILYAVNQHCCVYDAAAYAWQQQRRVILCVYDR